MSDGEQDFATFEAAATGSDVSAADAVVEGEAKVIETTDKPADTPLELTEGDEAVDVPEGEEGGEEEPADEPEDRKRRSKPAAQRIAELTARLREAERKLEAKPAEEAKAPDKPKPEDFEFGEADPAYIDKLTDWKIESREAEKAKADGARADQTAAVDRLNAGVATAEATAKEKYTDFDDRIADAIEARGGEPLPPLLTIGIGVSPVGGDIIYRLATDEAVSEKLEKLAKGGQATSNAMAMAFGELEGEYLADGDDADLDIADPLDMARMMGRMRARLAGKAVPKEKPPIKTTKAPEPPADRARGGTGRFEVGADTADFAAFERKVNGAR
jgi:hypothetical protein